MNEADVVRLLIIAGAGAYYGLGLKFVTSDIEKGRKIRLTLLLNILFVSLIWPMFLAALWLDKIETKMNSRDFKEKINPVLWIKK